MSADDATGGHTPTSGARSEPTRRLCGALAGAVACLATFAVARADSRALGEIPLPPEAISRVVASDIVQNGRLVSIATLEPRDGLGETLAFYRDAWPARENDPGHRETRAGGWGIVSRLDGDVNLVVQLREGVSGPTGFISVMSLAPVARTRFAPAPMPAGGQLLSTTTAEDESLDASTSVVSSTARAGEVAAFYRDAMRRAGWKLVSDRAAGGPVALLFDGRRARLEIVVADIDGGSVAVINEVRDGD